MSKTIENLKSGNYSVVENQGVSVTEHFIDCLEKEFADLEAKLAESESRFQAHKQNDARIIQDQTDLIENLKQQLAESEEFLVATKWKVQDLNKQLADTETQNKRVLEKLELIVSANQELEQQLEEKEKEIERLKSENHALMSDNAYQETDIFELNSFKEYYKNNKISFAVEQLTEIRDYVKNCWSLDTTEGKVRLDISKKIRLKIEALTHQHEDKGE